MFGVMLVDDESSVLKGLAELVDWPAMGAEIVASATGGQEALSLLRKVPVHILITDICMPEVDGLTLIAGARALYPALRCIVVSAHDEFEYVRRALTLGVENYLLKPINAGELAETLSKTIENIEREGSAPAPSAEAAAFRNNILDRWVNSSIQDFELAERAALLQIRLDAREYRALVSAPADCRSLDERLAYAAANLDALKRALSDAGIASDVFIDRHANLSAILRGDDMAGCRGVLSNVLERLGSGMFSSVGPAVTSAYLVDASYKCACFLLPYRYLDPDARHAWCDEYPLARAFASSELPAFEQAMDACDGAGAMEPAERWMRRGGQCAFAQALRRLLPFGLRLLAFFDDAMHNACPPPEAVVRQLRRLSASADAAALLAGFALAVGAAAQELSSRRSALHPTVRRVLDFMSVSYGKEISLKTVADQVNMHPSYFGQLFRAETGQLFNEYLTSLRLRHARSLLAGTGRRIGEISAAVGIAQQSYFNRLFKKEYGVTPAEYRRALAKNGE